MLYIRERSDEHIHFLAGKHEGKGPLGAPGCRRVRNIKIDFA
jgi:hypothetical protein